MYCTNCGNQVPPTAVVCGYCGHRLKSAIGSVPQMQGPGRPAGGMPPWLKWLGGLLLTGILVPALLYAGRAWMNNQLDGLLEKFFGGASAQSCDHLVPVADVTVPDGTIFNGGDSFDKVWRVQNDGACEWTPEYQLAFFSGEQMSGPDGTALGFIVAPGQTVDLLVRLKAPDGSGTYRGYWMLKNRNGQMFGFGPDAQDPLRIEIQVREDQPQAAVQSADVSPTATKSNQRCSLFEGMDMKIVWMDPARGSNQVQFYVKMPGGVPGLEKKISGQGGTWAYEFKIGDHTTSACYVIPGYRERLYCDFTIPPGYDASIRPVELHVNECSRVIFEDEHAEIPALKQAASSGGGGSDNGAGGAACTSGLDPGACAAAGGTYHSTFCSNPPCPAWCICQ